MKQDWDADSKWFWLAFIALILLNVFCGIANIRLSGLSALTGIGCSRHKSFSFEIRG